MNKIQVTIYNHVEFNAYNYDGVDSFYIFAKEDLIVEDCFKLVEGVKIVNSNPDNILFTPAMDNRFIVISCGLSKEERINSILSGMDRLSINN